MKHKINTVFFIAVFFILLCSSYYYNINGWLLLIPPFLWFLITAAGSGLIYSNYHVKTYCSNADTITKQIALSFDDGPHPETEKVLALLKKYNAKATFFCIGTQIEKYPDILKQIIADGHTIGNHSYSHAKNFGFLRKVHLIEEIQKADELINKYTGLKPMFFRPPYGATSPALAAALKKTGHYVIGWSVRSLDTVIKEEATILERIKSRFAPGGIVLMHDTSGKSVAVLEQLLVFLQQNGYRCLTVDNLLNMPAYED